ncbi:hypothetical protein H2248_004816 [Termitomyces sp. 'cryptogamus']|nr:hypothetical protein H2248_004816 [Termitomyces sp. 'cryptogamus']
MMTTFYPPGISMIFYNFSAIRCMNYVGQKWRQRANCLLQVAWYSPDGLLGRCHYDMVGLGIRQGWISRRKRLWIREAHNVPEPDGLLLLRATKVAAISYHACGSFQLAIRSIPRYNGSTLTRCPSQITA